MIDKLKSFFVVNGQPSKKRIAIAAFGVLVVVAVIHSIVT